MNDGIKKLLQTTSLFGALTLFTFAQGSDITPSTILEGDLSLNGATHAKFTINWEPSTLMEGPIPQTDSHSDDGSGDESWSETYYKIRFKVGSVHLQLKRNDNNFTMLDKVFPLYMNASNYSRADFYEASFEMINTGCPDGILNSQLIQPYMTLETNLNVSLAGIKNHKIYSANDIERVLWTSPDRYPVDGLLSQHEFEVYDAEEYQYLRTHGHEGNDD